MNESLPDPIARLLQHPLVWQGRHTPGHQHSRPTGHPALDEALHLHGWPLGASSELLLPHPCGGELSLLWPLLQQCQERWICLIDPPQLPFAPAWERLGINTRQLLLVHSRTPQEQLWSSRQALLSGACEVVIGWNRYHQIHNRDQRQLQQAAADGQSIHIQISPQQHQHNPSPCALRLLLQPLAQPSLQPFLQQDPHQLQITVLKQRGGWSGQTLQIPLHHGQLPSHQTASAPRSGPFALPNPWHPGQAIHPATPTVAIPPSSSVPGH